MLLLYINFSLKIWGLDLPTHIWETFFFHTHLFYKAKTTTTKTKFRLTNLHKSSEPTWVSWVRFNKLFLRWRAGCPIWACPHAVSRCPESPRRGPRSPLGGRKMALGSLEGAEWPGGGAFFTAEWAKRVSGPFAFRLRALGQGIFNPEGGWAGAEGCPLPHL